MEAAYSSTGTYFSANSSFWLMETSFLSSGNSIVLFRVFFCWLKLLLKLEGSKFLKKNHITASEHQFLKFFQRFFKVEAAFPCSGNIFFNKSFIRVVGMNFLHFDQSNFFVTGNHYWNLEKTVFKERTYSC